MTTINNFIRQITASCFQVLGSHTSRTFNPEWNSTYTIPSSRGTTRQHKPRPGLRLPRSAWEGTVRGQRLGGTVATGGAPDDLEHAPTIPRGLPPNHFTSVTSMVCSIAPTANTPPLFGVVFLCPDSKHPSCVRGRVPFSLTECASVCYHSSGHYMMEAPTTTT